MHLVLAPIRGITDAAFRTAFAELFGGFDEALAPFVAPETARPLRPKDLSELSPSSNAKLPTVPQILAGDPLLFLQTAHKLADAGCRQVNWNLGCPHPQVTRRARGAGLLPHPDRIAAFLEAVVPAARLAISVKLRLGLTDAHEVVAVLEVLNRFPLSEVILHPRTADQMYKGRADLEAFARVAPLCRHALVYNGDIVDAPSFAAVRARVPGVDRFMIGRGALSEPMLPRALRGEPIDPADRLDRMRTFHERLLEHKLSVLRGPAHVLDKMAALWEYWQETIPGRRKAIKRLRKCRELERYRHEAADIFRTEPAAPGTTGHTPE